MSLTGLLQRGDLWYGRGVSPSAQPRVTTGHPELDDRLGGGWPVGAISELLLDQQGIGELRLLMPTLARWSQQGRWQAWVEPPYVPYAPALAAAGIDLSRFLRVRAPEPNNALWALEQVLRSGSCAAVVGWAVRADTRRLRRLQLAAEQGGASLFLFLPLSAAQRPSPAAVRLELRGSPEGLRVHLLKRRGGWPQDLVLDMR